MVECKKAQPKEVMLPANLAKSRAAGARGLGFPAAAAAYAAAYSNRGGFPGYPTAAAGLLTGYPTPGFAGFGYFPAVTTATVAAITGTPPTISTERGGQTFYETAPAAPQTVTHVVDSRQQHREDSQQQQQQQQSAHQQTQEAVYSQDSTQVISQVTNPSSPAVVAQALSALSLKLLSVQDTCAMMPVINSYNQAIIQNQTNARPYPVSSPGPLERMYSQDGGYVTSNSPQPSAFPALAINRGPLITAAFANGYH